MLEMSTIKDYKILEEFNTDLAENEYIVEDLKTHEIYLLKSLKVDQSKRTLFEKYFSIWQKLSETDEHIVKLAKFFYDKKNAFVLAEFCDGGNLDALKRRKKEENSRFSEPELSKITCNLFQGLRAMLKRNIVHLDLNLSNIWISKGVYKIGEFNFKRLLADEGNNTRFTAPEVYVGKKPSCAADAYSIGAILYELMAFTPAFGSNVQAILLNKFCALDSSLGYSEGLISLVSRLLALEPSQRPTNEDILESPLLARTRVSGVEDGLHEQVEEIVTLRKTVSDLEKVVRDLLETQKTEKHRLEAEAEGKVAAMERKIEAMQAASLTSPDYTKPRNLSQLSGGFVADENGWIFGRLYSAGHWPVLYVNGTSLVLHWGNGVYYSGNGDYCPIFFPLRKGDKLTISSNTGSEYFSFYPCVKQ